MSQITLRNLDPEIEKMIRHEAKKRKISLNRAIQDMLQQKISSREKRKTPRGQLLKSLAGGWNDNDVKDFFETIKSCEQIDESMWK